MIQEGYRNLRGEAGFSIFEILVSMLIAAVLFGNIISTLLTSTNQHHDLKIIAAVDEQAQMLADTMAFEIRMLGAGMPLGVEHFDMLDGSLGDAPQPILTTSTANYLQIRLDEVGTESITTSSFTPSFINRDFDVHSTAGFEVGDVIYLANYPVGGSEGLRGEITAITGNKIQIDSTFIVSAAATFQSGSLIRKISDITFDNGPSGISRQEGGNPAVTLLPRSSFTITYLDEDGNTLAPPLSTSVIRNSLNRLQLSVSVDSKIPLKDGNIYTATVTNEIFLRNLHLSRE